MIPRGYHDNIDQYMTFSYVLVRLSPAYGWTGLPQAFFMTDKTVVSLSDRFGQHMTVLDKMLNISGIFGSTYVHTYILYILSTQYVYCTYYTIQTVHAGHTTRSVHTVHTVPYCTVPYRTVLCNTSVTLTYIYIYIYI